MNKILFENDTSKIQFKISFTKSRDITAWLDQDKAIDPIKLYSTLYRFLLYVKPLTASQTPNSATSSTAMPLTPFVVEEIRQLGQTLFKFQPPLTLDQTLCFLFPSEAQYNLFHPIELESFALKFHDMETKTTTIITDVSKQYISRTYLPMFLQEPIVLALSKTNIQNVKTTESVVPNAAASFAVGSSFAPRDDVPIKPLNDYSFSEWTTKVFNEYYQNDDRMLRNEPELVSISKFRRFGAKYCFEFFCKFRYQKSTSTFEHWLKYSDLVLNPEYEDKLKNEYNWNARLESTKYMDGFQKSNEYEDDSDFDYGDDDPEVNKKHEEYLRYKQLRKENGGTNPTYNMKTRKCIGLPTGSMFAAPRRRKKPTSRTSRTSSRKSSRTKSGSRSRSRSKRDDSSESDGETTSKKPNRSKKDDNDENEDDDGNDDDEDDGESSDDARVKIVPKKRAPRKKTG